MHIEFVCMGNICRSPAAEAVMRQRLDREGLDEVSVASAGLGSWHVGEMPHPLSRAEGEARGYEFTEVGRHIQPGDLAQADLVVAMDEQNLEELQDLAPTPEAVGRIVLLGAFAPDADSTGAQPVPDPYGQGRAAFVAMYDQIEPAVQGLVEVLQQGRLAQYLPSAR